MDHDDATPMSGRDLADGEDRSGSVVPSPREPHGWDFAAPVFAGSELAGEVAEVSGQVEVAGGSGAASADPVSTGSGRSGSAWLGTADDADEPRQPVVPAPRTAFEAAATTEPESWSAPLSMPVGTTAGMAWSTSSTDPAAEEPPAAATDVMADPEQVAPTSDRSSAAVDAAPAESVSPAPTFEPPTFAAPTAPTEPPPTDARPTAGYLPTPAPSGYAPTPSTSDYASAPSIVDTPPATDHASTSPAADYPPAPPAPGYAPAPPAVDYASAQPATDYASAPPAADYPPAQSAASYVPTQPTPTDPTHPPAGYSGYPTTGGPAYAPTSAIPSAYPPPAFPQPSYAPPAQSAYPQSGFSSPAPAGYAPPGYSPPGYSQPGYSHPGYPQPGQPPAHPQSAPAYANAAPSLYPGQTAGGYPAATPTGPLAPAGSPWPGGTGVTVPTAAPGRTRGRGRRVLLVTVLALLLVVAGGQAYMLKRTNDRLDTANRDRASADAIANNRINTLTTRAAQLESQLKSQLNPVTVAAKIAPSVWEIDVGDFLGTAWAVRKSPGGGTDLITNYHVVEPTYKTGGRTVDLVRDKQRMHATVVKVIKANDVALVHVTQDLPVLTVSMTAVVPGEAVLAEGTPLGWQSSVSAGIVSNVNRRVHTPNGMITYFQFDAGINPGNSGGPVVDADGDVVGIASAVFIDTENDVPAQSMSLAIPITTACQALAAC